MHRILTPCVTVRARYEPLPEQPSPTEATLPAWFENYGVRRYGKEVQAAVDVWTLLGSTVHAGNGGGGFGSEISTYPTMPTPPPPPPPAVAGFKVYPQHGYFGVVGNDTYAAPSARASIADCGQLCLKTDNCKGFEVYVDTPPAFGNCYFFKDTTTPFTVLTPCATYVRSSESDSKGVQSAEAIKLQAASSSSSSSSSIHPFSHVPASVVAHKGPDMTAAGTDAYITAFQKLVAASSELGSVPSYRFDLVDVAREVISKAFSVSQRYITTHALNYNTHTQSHPNYILATRGPMQGCPASRSGGGAGYSIQDPLGVEARYFRNEC